MPLAPPAVVLAAVAGRILDLAREERPALAQLLQDVAAEGGTRLDPLDDPAVEWPVAPPHERLQHRQVLARVEEGAPLDELPLLPEQPVELGGVERAEAAPEDEVLRRRDAGDRVELEEAEAAHGLEHSVGVAPEALRADGDAPRLLDRQLTHIAPPRARARGRGELPRARASP